MIKNILVLSLFAAGLMACNIEDTGASAQADTVVLDVRCGADADCPAGFECETEVEHGVDASYCVSHDEHAASQGDCPAGYELETEHEGTFCKPHGGGSDDSGSDDNGGGSDDSGSDDSGKG